MEAEHITSTLQPPFPHLKRAVGKVRIHAHKALGNQRYAVSVVLCKKVIYSLSAPLPGGLELGAVGPTASWGHQVLVQEVVTHVNRTGLVQ